MSDFAGEGGEEDYRGKLRFGNRSSSWGLAKSLFSNL